MKKIVLLSIVSALYADMTPENVLGVGCLKGYHDRYKSKQDHKVFVFAREEKTGKDRCTWNYGYDSVVDAKKESLKDCQKYNLNAECKVVDIDGKFIAKEGDFSYITPPNNTPLTKEESKKLLDDASQLLLGSCITFFKKYLKDKEHKVFTYSLDPDGKYACSKSVGNSLDSIKISSLKNCNKYRKTKGDKSPKSECKIFAQDRKIVAKASDYGVKIIPKSDKYLSTSEYESYLNSAKAIINEGPCLYQFKYYLRGTQHQAYYLANGKGGVQACGRSEDEFSPKIAQESAFKKCQAMVKKKSLKATCHLYATNFDVSGKAEDFGIKKSIEDYKVSIHKGNLIKIKSYIKDGFDANIQTDKDGITPIFVAAGQSDEAFFFTLIEKGADIKHKAKDTSTLLLAAAAGGNPTIIRYLLDKGFDVNAKGTHGMTPLMGALGHLQTYAASILMQSGADASIKSEDGKGADDMAKKWKLDLEGMKNINPKKMDSEGTYPLFNAVKYNDNFMIDKLIKLGANPNKITDDLGWSAFYLTDSEKTLKQLIKVGADINHQDYEGKTALIKAVDNREFKKIKLLLSLGADKGIKDKENQSAYDLIKDQKGVSQEIKNLLK